ncbi:hypothetical protein FHX15_000050 [Rhizobium sp. BK650]|nr:hypothetical protein [Rhizobium sp. BK650]
MPPFEPDGITSGSRPILGLGVAVTEKAINQLKPAAGACINTRVYGNLLPHARVRPMVRSDETRKQLC